MKTYSILSFVVMIMLGCAGQPSDTEQPGSCKIDCSSRYVPPSDAFIETLNAPSEVLCEGDDQEDADRPLTFRFKIEVPIDRQITNETADVEAGEGQKIFTFDGTQALGGIGFEPFVSGGVSVKRTNSEHQVTLDNQIQAEPAKYAGIVTPKSEWCSDSCGIMTFEVWPSCGGAVSAGVIAGAAKSSNVQ